jgi:hypothetical protein
MELHQTITNRLNKFIESQTIPHIIFHGASGSGKRTIMSNFISDIYHGDNQAIKDYVMKVNCAQGKGIKFIREDLKHFAKTHINTRGGHLFKSIILMNADKLTIDAQSALRRCIEVFSHTTRFFIIVEDRYKLLKPILSRFCEIYIPRPIINGVFVNLHKYNVDNTFGPTRNDTSRNTLLRRILTELSENPTTNNIRVCVDTLYDNAFCACNIISIIEGKNTFNIDNYRKHCALFRYNEMKKEFRSESLSMFFLLHAVFLRLTDSLENILLM